MFLDTRNLLLMLINGDVSFSRTLTNDRSLSADWILLSELDERDLIARCDHDRSD